MFSDERLSIHNCHGLGQRQCITDGYRTGGDLKMGNERTIFELNKAYPVVMSPMLDKEDLKEYFLKYLGYYYDENTAELDDNVDDF